MSLDIYWSEDAKETFDIIVNLIEHLWGELSAAKFITKTYQEIDLIASQPYLFTASISENIRRVVITKQTSMFYEAFDGHIVIYFFFDNRQEPFFD